MITASIARSSTIRLNCGLVVLPLGLLLTRLSSFVLSQPDEYPRSLPVFRRATILYVFEGYSFSSGLRLAFAKCNKIRQRYSPVLSRESFVLHWMRGMCPSNDQDSAESKQTRKRRTKNEIALTSIARNQARLKNLTRGSSKLVASPCKTCTLNIFPSALLVRARYERICRCSLSDKRSLLVSVILCERSVLRASEQILPCR